MTNRFRLVILYNTSIFRLLYDKGKNYGWKLGVADVISVRRAAGHLRGGKCFRKYCALACLWLLVVWIALTTFAFLRDLKTKKRVKDDKTAVSADMAAEKSEAESAKKDGAETEKILAESFAEDSVGIKPDDGEMRRME